MIGDITMLEALSLVNKWMFTRVYAQTHLFKVGVHKGLQ